MRQKVDRGVLVTERKRRSFSSLAAVVHSKAWRDIAWPGHAAMICFCSVYGIQIIAAGRRAGGKIGKELDGLIFTVNLLNTSTAFHKPGEILPQLLILSQDTPFGPITSCGPPGSQFSFPAYCSPTPSLRRKRKHRHSMSRRRCRFKARTLGRRARSRQRRPSPSIASLCSGTISCLPQIDLSRTLDIMTRLGRSSLSRKTF